MYSEWLKEMSGRLQEIENEPLTSESKRILGEKAIEPYGLWKKENGSFQKKKPSENQENHENGSDARAASQPQVDLIKKHMTGSKRSMIMEYLGGRKPEDLTVPQASQLIDTIFGKVTR